MPTIQEVRDAFNEAIDAIDALDRDLAAERRKIKMSGRPVDRTDAQNARLAEIIENRKALGEAKEDLIMETLAAYENASDLDALLEEINASNTGARDTLDHLKTMADYAEKAAKVASAVATAATKLADFVA